MAIDPKDVCLTIPTRGDVDLSEILNRLPDFKQVIVWDNSGMGPQLWKEGLDTRWSVDLLHPVPIGERNPNFAVYARYAAIAYTDAAVIATQDDDAIVPWEDVLAHYTPGRLVANMDRDRWGPNWGYPDSTLVGWGAVFDRDLPDKAFDLFEEKSGVTTFLAKSPAFKREVLPTGVIQQSNSPHRHWEPGTGWMTNEEFWRTCDVIFSSLTPRTVIDVGFRHLPWATAANRMWTGDPNHSKERNAVLNLCRKIRTWPDDDVRVP